MRPIDNDPFAQVRAVDPIRGEADPTPDDLDLFAMLRQQILAQERTAAPPASVSASDRRGCSWRTWRCRGHRCACRSRHVRCVRHYLLRQRGKRNGDARI